MTDEQNTFSPNNLSVDQTSLSEDQIVVPFAKSGNVNSQVSAPMNEPDDIFGDIDSLRVETAPTSPQQSISQAQDVLPVKMSGFSSILMKLFIIVIILVVLSGVAILAYPYIKSMVMSESDETENILMESEEIVVENPYDFEEVAPVDYGVTDEMIANDQNTIGKNPLPTIDSVEADEDEYEGEMIEDKDSLNEITTSENNQKNDQVQVDLNKDTDNDGLTDVEEEKLGTHKMKADTDNDGLSDRDEIMIHKTNPLEFDSDGDGLSDYDEIDIYKINPLLVDTDGDGYADGIEVSGGYNPNGPGKLEN